MYLSKLLLLLLSPFRRLTCIWMLLVPLFPGLAYPSPYFPVAFSLHLLLHVMSDRLKKGRERTRRRRGKWKKRNPLPFSPDPLPFYAGYHHSNAWIRAYILVLFFCSLGSKRIQSSVGNQLHWFFFFKGAKVRPVQTLRYCRAELNWSKKFDLSTTAAPRTFETKSCYCREARQGLPC